MFNFIRSLVSEPIYLFGFLALLILIGNILFVRKYPLTKLQWKKADYIWLSLASISVFGILEKNLIQIKAWEFTNATYQVRGTARSIEDRLSEQWICIPDTRGVYSPENYKEIEIQKDLACQWAKTVLKAKKGDLDSLVEIDISTLPKINAIDRHYREPIDRVMSLISTYNSEVKERNQLKSIEKSDPIKALEFFSPILFCIGLAIRVVKTMGEVKIEKGK